MAALEERAWKFELGIDHIRSAFKRANDGFMNACKMLEAEQRRNQKLEAENAKLRELVRNLYACACRTECDECPYVEEPCDFKYDLRELGIEVDE